MANNRAEQRPDPSSLLNRLEEDAARAKRGKLKIFFGSSAGVGKTYAMLQQAHRRKAEGVDVLAGVVETHGRVETQALLEGLPQLPQLEITHRDVTLKEFDIDAALKRRPTIILVDELAHNNAPGSRHPKRWQDVEELLDSGIDVYSTLNVQHLESLNDVVTSITGISVKEMVPDLLFDEASDVVLVDTSPDELLKRLQDGKVYVAPGANERAMQNFFRKTNLMSLRELALRRTAEYVDTDTDEERQREGLNTPNVAGDRLLVCIGPDKLAAKLVRTTRRLATALKAPWTALYVEAPGQNDPRLRQYIQQILASAERNGAHVMNIEGTSIGSDLLNYAKANGITKLIIGKPVRPIWQELFRPDLVDYVIRHSGNIDVHVVTGPAPALPIAVRSDLKPGEMTRTYGLALFVLAALTGFGWLIKPYMTDNSNIAMLFLMGAVLVAAWLGRGPALLYALGTVGCFNFFFVEPIFTFNVYDQGYWLTFAVMMLASLVISSQALRLRDQALLSQRRESDTQIFYQLTRTLAGTRGRKPICDVVINHLHTSLQATAGIWLPDEGDDLVLFAGAGQGDLLKEETVAQWCYRYKQEAGFGTNTMPGSPGYYLPIQGTEKCFGVLAAFPKVPDTPFSPDESNRLETIISLLASALERAFSAENAESANISREQEKMRNILLSSVSHDLRSPLSAISGAAETLLQNPRIASDEMAAPLLGSISSEADRLTRTVNNLLDITRYAEGKLQLNLQPYYLSEIIGSAVTSCAIALKNHRLDVDVASDLPMLNIDGLLINQVLVNILDNAAKHTPPGTQIKLSAKSTSQGILILVRDNGPGFAAGDEKRIFEKFATSKRGDKPKGTGLGLAICQAIITAHHGKIWAENIAGGGTGFNILLPENRISS